MIGDGSAALAAKLVAPDNAAMRSRFKAAGTLTDVSKLMLGHEGGVPYSASPAV